MNDIMTTRLYVDMDGVLNIQGSTWGDTLMSANVSPSGGTFRINWSPTLMEHLNSLTDIELVLLTTWCDEARTLLMPLFGITHPVRVLTPLSGYVTFPSIQWKTTALAADQAASPSPFIWLDDEHTINSRNVGESLGGLVPAIHWTTGVTPEIFDDMEEYLATQKV